MTDITRFEEIQEIRKMNIVQRINQLFIKIDNLGNYTQSSWFSNLEFRNFVRLYRYLYDIWNYRSQMEYMTRLNICPYPIPINQLDMDAIRHHERLISHLDPYGGATS